MMNTLDVLEFYDLSHKTLERMRKKGMPFSMINSKSYAYDYEEVEKWINLCGKVYPNDRILIGMKKARELTGLTKDEINRERYNFNLPYYELRGNEGNTLYRFDKKEFLYWFEDYKERKGLI